MTSWAPLALTTVTAGLLALPITPALYELWKRGDATPLPTSRHDGRIRNFAEAFQLRLEPLRPQLERCRAKGETSRTSLEGMEVLLVGGNVGGSISCDSDVFDFHKQLTKGIAALMSGGDVEIPAGRVVDADVYADGRVSLGEGAALRAAACRDDIILGKNSVVLRWLHTQASIYLRRGSIACGRLSAGQSIELEPETGFHHMHAPRILTVEDGSGSFSTSRFHDCNSGAIGNDSITDSVNAFKPEQRRFRIHGNFVLPAGETLNANVIATGDLRLCPGARLFGSVKSYGETILEKDACVHGSIVSRRTVRLGPCSFVVGPVIAEDEVLIAAGTLVGGRNALTTISSRVVQIAAGCELHGTVWARTRGTVEG
ncbi:MAG: hypothetical protein WB566_07565 [Terriglobales bacterium]